MVETRRLKELRTGMLSRSAFPEPPYVIALSGGADSAALASLARANSDDVEGVHVHHGLDASDALERAAQQIAEAVDMKVTTVNIEVSPGPSPERQARDSRYRAIDGSVEPDVKVLTGHTRDDHAETVLLNLIRGAGLRGLTGIPYHRPPNYYRPFLGVTRSETREYATLAGLPFHDDPTNLDRGPRRNWIRLELIPRLQEVNPSILESLARTADNLLDDADFLDQLAGEPRSLGDGSLVKIPVGDLVAAPSPLRRRILEMGMAEIRPDLGLTTDEVHRLLDLIEGRSTATEIEGGIRVRRGGPFLELRSPD